VSIGFVAQAGRAAGAKLLDELCAHPPPIINAPRLIPAL